MRITQMLMSAPVAVAVQPKASIRQSAPPLQRGRNTRVRRALLVPGRLVRKVYLGGVASQVFRGTAVAVDIEFGFRPFVDVVRLQLSRG